MKLSKPPAPNRHNYYSEKTAKLLAACLKRWQEANNFTKPGTMNPSAADLTTNSLTQKLHNGRAWAKDNWPEDHPFKAILPNIVIREAGAAVILELVTPIDLSDTMDFSGPPSCAKQFTSWLATNPTRGMELILAAASPEDIGWIRSDAISPDKFLTLQTATGCKLIAL